MAKGQKRSGREPKKPKQKKTAVSSGTSSYATAQGTAGGPATGTKK